MALSNLPTILLVAAILAIVGWYFWHVTVRMMDGVRALKTLPDAIERAFDGSVPPWLRLLRLIMVIVICFVAAMLVVRKF